MTKTSHWATTVPALGRVPNAAQARLIEHALAVSRCLPHGRRARFRVTHEVLSDLTEAVLVRTDLGWDPDLAVTEALAEFGDPRAAGEALSPLINRASYRRRATSAAAVTAALVFWWLALFPFATGEPWSERAEPFIPTIADEVARTSIVTSILAAAICRLVIRYHHRIAGEQTSIWVRVFYWVEAAGTAGALAGLSTYTAFRYEVAPRSISASSLFVAFLLGVAVVAAVVAIGRETKPGFLRARS